MQRIDTHLGKKKNSIGAISSASSLAGVLQELHLLVFAVPGTSRDSVPLSQAHLLCA